MLKMQNKVGLNLVKPAVVFKNPFESIPLAMARIKKIYPENKLKLFILLLRIALHHDNATTIFP